MKYDIYIFDCDGVILNSNNIKSDAFYDSVADYGENFSREFVEYHKENGGISRFEKFKYFFENILKRLPRENEIQNLLDRFAKICDEKLSSCSLVPGVKEFLVRIDSDKTKVVISGGIETEIRKAFRQKDIEKEFAQILGSPITKNKHMQNLNFSPLLKKVYFGDSLLDYEVAMEFDCDFYFVSDFSEMKDPYTFFQNQNVRIIKNFSELL